MNKLPKELKPCPFCGGRDLTIIDYIGIGGAIYVLCHSCGSSSGTYNTRNEAITAWNRRSEDE